MLMNDVHVRRFVCLVKVHWFISDEHIKFEITPCNCRTISIQSIMRDYVRLMENLIYVKSVHKRRCLSLLPNNNARPPLSLTLCNPIFFNQIYHMLVK